MSGLLLKNVSKIYPGGQQAVHDFNLEIEDNELLVLSGPDGCGKAALLRMIAGLEDITSGTLSIDGVDMTHAEPRERNIAMIFRNSILYPEMTVEENLTFALRMAKMQASEIAQRKADVVADLKLEKLLAKLPGELSALENFQVLLGRALMRRPRILLMDSTIADCDEELQEQLRQEFLDIHKRLNMTVIYVTENQRSAMTLGSRMIVMSEGEISQQGTPEELVRHPESSFVAGVVGFPPMNFFVATVAQDGDHAVLNFKKGSVTLSAEKSEVLLAGGYLKKEVLAGIRADAITVLDKKQKGAANTIQAKVQGMEAVYGRPALRFLTDISEGICMTAECPAAEQIVLALDAERIQVFDRETEQTILY